jgi:hypothetical protein
MTNAKQVSDAEAASLEQKGETVTPATEAETTPAATAAAVHDAATIKDAHDFLLESGVPQAVIDSTDPQVAVGWAAEAAGKEPGETAAAATVGEGGGQSVEQILAGMASLTAAQQSPLQVAQSPVPQQQIAVPDAGAAFAPPAALKTALDAVDPAASAALNDYLTQVGQTMAQQSQYAGFLSGMVEDMALGGAQARHATAYPQIKDARVMEGVKNLTTALVQSGRYQSLDAAIDAAVGVVFKDVKPAVAAAAAAPDAADAADAAKPDRRARLAALRKQATDKPPDNTNKTQAAGLTNDEAATRIGELIAAGRMEEARRLSEQTGGSKG